MVIKIGLLSDTHGFVDPQLFDLFASCDEVWHAGDIGSAEVADTLEERFSFRAVYGNIDDASLRVRFAENQRFEIDGLKVWMTHIAGAPGRYNARVRSGLKADSPGLFVCGHSHILKVMPVPAYRMLHINPGACGRHGFHKIRTAIRFEIEKSQVQNLEVIELGLRGQL